MFWNRQEREVRELQDQVRQLKGDLAALARDVLDLNQSVDRWMRRDRTRTARERQVDESATDRQDSSPPPGLRGVRLRRWLRANGRELTQVPVNELGNESENGG